METTETISCRTLLVVEDLEENLFLVRSFLEELGFSVETAPNGRVAIEKAAQVQYAAILMDIEMPEIDGLDATKAIRHNEAQSGADRVPIMGMTGHSSEGIKRLCSMAGMDGFISKPLRFSALEDRINNLFAAT